MRRMNVAMVDHIAAGVLASYNGDFPVLTKVRLDHVARDSGAGSGLRVTEHENPCPVARRSLNRLPSSPRHGQFSPGGAVKVGRMRCVPAGTRPVARMNRGEDPRGKIMRPVRKSRSR
jgi:hypothetical protein